MITWSTRSGYRLHQLLGGRSNSYLLRRGTRAVLIDTGRKNKMDRIASQLRGLNIDRIDALLLTHTHFDHAENAAAIAARYKAKIIVHQAESGSLKAGNSRLPRGSMLVTRWLMALLAERLQPLFAYPPADADILVEDELKLHDFGLDATVIHTPGHSPGSTSLIVDGEIALVGDAMFGIFPNSVFPPFADDPGQMVLSWGKLLETGCTSFLPGHGTEISRDLLERQYTARSGNSGLTC
jgi:glyoxylase-like metal-dependent hydrolase (beta-lactamase superfamily II)